MGSVRGCQSPQEQQVPQHADLVLALDNHCHGRHDKRCDLEAAAWLSVVQPHPADCVESLQLLCGASLLVLQLVRSGWEANVN